MCSNIDAARVIDPPPRIARLRQALTLVDGTLRGAVDAVRPYVTGLEKLPEDGRYLLVGNHTQAAGAETFLIPHFVRRATGRDVKVLADRAFGRWRGLAADVMAAYGGVVGSPESVRALMAHGETILVFPGGGQEIAKFKGEENRLRWRQRQGFAREAIAAGYLLVPVGLIGGDDVYRSLVSRDSLWAKATGTINAVLPGSPPEMAMPLLRGVGPTLIPRPQRLYIGFGEPIPTVRPASVSEAAWVTDVAAETKGSLERIMDDLLTVRSRDPYRSLNPLAWRSAAQPVGAIR